VGPEKKSPLALFFLPLGKLEQEDLGAAEEAYFSRVSHTFFKGITPAGHASTESERESTRARERARESNCRGEGHGREARGRYQVGHGVREAG
jgi:hypothetical protein